MWPTKAGEAKRCKRAAGKSIATAIAKGGITILNGGSSGIHVSGSRAANSSGGKSGGELSRKGAACACLCKLRLSLRGAALPPPPSMATPAPSSFPLALPHHHLLCPLLPPRTCINCALNNPDPAQPVPPVPPLLAVAAGTSILGLKSNLCHITFDLKSSL